MILTLKTSGANSYIITGKKQWVLIDTGLNVNHLLREIKKTHFSMQRMALILVTHAHSDHVGALSALKMLCPNVPIAAHRLESAAIIEGCTQLNGPMYSLLKLKGKKNRYKPVSVDIVVDAEFDLKPYGINGVVQWTPGHTPGSLSVFVEQSAIVGDLFMNLFHSLLPLYISDQDQYLHSCTQAISGNSQIFYVGHGGALTREQLVGQLPKLHRQLSKRA